MAIDRKPLLSLDVSGKFKPRDISDFSVSANLHEMGGDTDIFAVKKRKAWLAFQTDSARCDFADGKAHIALRNGGFRTLTLWRKSAHGRTLLEIKEDPKMVPFVSQKMAEFITSVLGANLDPETFAIITTPKRRHKERNFASLCSAEIAKILGIPFYEDVAVAKSHLRVNAVFEFNNIPKHKNLIVFDDFITSGQTLFSMKKLLDTKGFNCIYFAAVHNKL